MDDKLLVPVRDRRRRRRILTLKNFGIFMAVVVVLFAGISIYSEMGGKTAEGSFGRLYGSQVVPAEPKTPNLEIVQEAPIADETVPDPFLVAPAAREQYLGTYDDPFGVPPPVPLVDEQPQDFAPRTPMLGQREERLTIVGDSTGVGIAVEKQEPPALSGGIFKQE